jgi:hypothetical protein
MTAEKHSHVIHAIFKCQECDWKYENYIDGDKKAYKHASKTGHFVRGEIGYSVTYNKDCK